MRLVFYDLTIKPVNEILMFNKPSLFMDITCEMYAVCRFEAIILLTELENLISKCINMPPPIHVHIYDRTIHVHIYDHTPFVENKTCISSLFQYDVFVTG